MSSDMTPAEAVVLFVSNLQKRQRNLVKRKGKLDHYREMLHKGETLNDEQKKAVEGYESVMQSITVVQEILNQSKELTDDVNEAVRHSESQAELSREKHTLSFLRIHICLMQLIDALDNPELRSAIIKASSVNQLRMLDAVKNLITAPVLVNWPGTNSACLSNAPDFIQKQDAFALPAQYLHDFVMGRSVPIPVPEEYEGSQRKLNFKEARMLCFRLLATPAIQRTLGAPILSGSVNSVIDETRIHSCIPNHADSSTVRHERVGCEPYVTPDDQTLSTIELESHVGSRQADHISAPIVERPVKPLVGNFNFLQASKVMSPDQENVNTSNASHAQPATHHIPGNFSVVQPTEAHVEHGDGIPEECDDYQDSSDNAYEVQTSHCEGIHKPYANSVESGRSIPLSDAEGESTTVPLKPTSYADLFRQQGRVSRENNTTGGRRCERIAAPEASTIAAETSDYRGTAGEYEHIHPPVNSYRGRGASGDPRGGRGYSSRGFSRGYTNGPPRRPYGGPRVGRGASHPGRGRAAFHGPHANVAQA